MESLRIIPDLEVVGFRDEPYVVTEHDGQIIIGGLARGTEAGNPVVLIAIDDPETGGFMVMQTTLALFLTAADTLKTKHGDPRGGSPGDPRLN